jgi:hypothetical protein
MTEAPRWASSRGLPTLHVARAALHVGAIVDRRGSPTIDAEESYWHHATGGIFAPDDLNRGQLLLVDVGLLVERDGTLTPTSQLAELLDGSVGNALAALTQMALELAAPASPDAARSPPDLVELVPDAARREELLIGLARRYDETLQRLVGDIGEEIVIDAARSELRAMGRPELAREVRRVSLLSDQLGYDVSAPRVSGRPRLLEVKATTAQLVGPSVNAHLSRNEADTGAALADWALVICAVDDIDRRLGHVVGWCGANALEDLRPLDSACGRWDQATFQVPVDRLIPGLPGVVT